MIWSDLIPGLALALLGAVLSSTGRRMARARRGGVAPSQSGVSATPEAPPLVVKRVGEVERRSSQPASAAPSPTAPLRMNAKRWEGMDQDPSPYLNDQTARVVKRVYGEYLR